MHLVNMDKLVQKPWLCPGKGFVPSLIILPNGNTLDLFSTQSESIVEMLYSVDQRLMFTFCPGGT